MTTIKRGTPATLIAEWRLYAGGPAVDVTDVTISVWPAAGGAAVLAATATGVANPFVGYNTYSWTPAADLDLGDYLVTWDGIDPDSEAVTATELISVTDALAAPLGGPYATLAQLKAQMGIADSNTARDTELTRRLVSASEDINAWCHRQFGRTDSATTRKFYVGTSGVDLHDFWTDDGLEVIPYLNGVASTAWDMSTMDLEPADGIVNQVPGWPYNRIRMAMADHPLWRAAAWTGYKVHVTAKWGWAAVPENVRTSCLMLAVADDKAGDAPFGVAGFGDFAVRIRQNPMVEEKLKDYVVDPIKVAA
jgi:hypothetical protein